MKFSDIKVPESLKWTGGKRFRIAVIERIIMDDRQETLKSDPSVYNSKRYGNAIFNFGWQCGVFSTATKNSHSEEIFREAKRIKELLDSGDTSIYN